MTNRAQVLNGYNGNLNDLTNVLSVKEGHASPYSAFICILSLPHEQN
jgi:hypothetical protein